MLGQSKFQYTTFFIDIKDFSEEFSYQTAL